MMSGSWDEQQATQAIEMGCKIQHKPFKASELNEWLDEVEKTIEMDCQLQTWIHKSV
jgi:hypothetical protein